MIDAADHVLAKRRLRVQDGLCGQAPAVGHVEELGDDGRRPDIDGHAEEGSPLRAGSMATPYVGPDLCTGGQAMIEDLVLVETRLRRHLDHQVAFHMVLASKDLLPGGMESQGALTTRPPAAARGCKDYAGMTGGLKKGRVLVDRDFLVVRLEEYAVMLLS